MLRLLRPLAGCPYLWACIFQVQAEGGEGGIVLPTVNGASVKKRGGKKGAAAAAAAAEAEGAVQTQNGQGDTLSQSSSILQARGLAAELRCGGWPPL